jgi:hypothetical protein
MIFRKIIIKMKSKVLNLSPKHKNQYELNVLLMEQKWGDKKNI